jgi:hypothetical protein
MTSNDIRPRRPLTKSEAFILQQIQDLYGHQNAETDVFFTDLDEAAISVKDKDGVRSLLAVLTNLAAECEDGTIASLEELRKVLLPLEMVPPKI